MGRPDSNRSAQTGGLRPRGESEFPRRVAIPEHELLACIGRGSYGQVWLARNSMGVFRAVKIVFRDSFDNQRPFERELSGIRKFEPISRLHEGFIDILQVGINEDQGFFYYIMELGDDQSSGQSIVAETYVPNTLASEIARRGKLSLTECLKLGLALTHALAELHKHGLVHRDIKPSNIIFVDGSAKLVDIGLVARVDDTRSFVGTEGFIPPEGPGTPQADLYSLGKVLYEASTGNDRQDFPELPGEWAHSPEYGALLELNEIILQACQPDLRARYLSAWDMHGDLVVVVNGKSVKRLRHLERRLAQLKRAAGVVALVATLASFILYYFYREWRVAADEHQREIDANLNSGDRAVDSGDLFGALPYFAEALRLDQGNRRNQATERLRLGSVLAQSAKLTQMWLEPMQVSDGEFSPDGRSVLLAQYFGKMELRDVQTGKLRAPPFGSELGLRSAVYSPDGRFILATSESDTAIVRDAASLSEVLSLPHPNKVYSGRFSPDGKRIVTCCNDGVARVWDATTGLLLLALPAHSNLVAFACFSHDGKLIVTASHDETARLWHAADGTPAGPPMRHPMWVTWAAFSPDDQRLVTGCDDHKARVWDVATSSRILPDLNHNDTVETVEFSPDGRLILTASFDGTLRLWRASDLQPLASNPILRHGERVCHASFSPDGRDIVTTCLDGSVRLWDLAGASTPPPRQRRMFCRDASSYLGVSNGRFELFDAGTGEPLGPSFAPFDRLDLRVESCPDMLALLPESQESSNQTQGPKLGSQSNPSPRVVQWVRLSARGDFVLVGSAGPGSRYVAEVWNTRTGAPVGPAVTCPAPLAGVAISDKGLRVATYGDDYAQIWNAETGKPLTGKLSVKNVVTSAVFSPDASALAITSGTNMSVWSAGTGKLLYPARSFPVPVVDVEFSRDGNLLVTSCSDPMLTRCSAQIWDPRTGRAIGEPLRHADGVLSASFNQDGSRVVTCSEDFTAKIWSTKTGRELGLTLRHEAQVQAADFSPNGQWVATASLDHTARIWDAETGEPITPPLHHLAGLKGIRFLPHEEGLVTVDGRGGTLVWHLPIDHKPVADILAMAELLSGGEFLGPASPPTHVRDFLETTWRQLRAKYPEDFTTSHDELVNWHKFQVAESEADGEWKAAAFHLAVLSRLCPHDSWMTDRLKHIDRRSTAGN